jgi:hypothetical protein
MNIKKGQLLAVKAPPLFEREYVYEVTASGDKQIRADLRHSPRVKKHWSPQEFALLQEHGIIRLIDAEDIVAEVANPESASQESQLDSDGDAQRDRAVVDFGPSTAVADIEEADTDT